MLKQILCCSLLIGQLCAGELPWPSFTGGVNGGVTGMMVAPDADQTDYFPTFEMSEDDSGLFSEFVEEADEAANSAPAVPAQIGGVAAQVSAPAQVQAVFPVKIRRPAPRFTAEEDEALLQIVHENPRLSWKERAKLFNESRVGNRTPDQLRHRFNDCLKSADERGKESPRFTAEEDEALIQIVQENPDLGWEERAKLFAEAGVSDPAVQRTARQLSNRYNGRLKSADGRKKFAPKSTAAEETGVLRYLRANPGKPNWNACLEQLIEQGIITRGSQTAKQISRRYNHYLKHRHDDNENSSDSDSDEEEGA